ncbi:MAG: hypothetical protein J7M38_11245, partial [Armatimonadetes bacterium]|nr:hypothetical protein [Armatimonadota bacterium]
PDMERDVRMMIPVARNLDVYWAIIGVRLNRIEVSFKQRPEVRAANPNVEVQPSFSSAIYWVPTEQFLEIQVDGEPLNREEFRALCDKYKTENAIRQALPAALKTIRIKPPEFLSQEAVPMAPYAPPWYVARPWMIWIAAAALMGLILLVMTIRWARGLRPHDQ